MNTHIPAPVALILLHALHKAEPEIGAVIQFQEEYSLNLQKIERNGCHSIVYTSELSPKMDPSVDDINISLHPAQWILDKPVVRYVRLRMKNYKHLVDEMIYAAAEFNGLVKQPVFYMLLEATPENEIVLVIDQNDASLTLDSAIIRSFAQSLHAKAVGDFDMVVIRYPIKKQPQNDLYWHETLVIRANSWGEVIFRYEERLWTLPKPQYIPYHIPIHLRDEKTEVTISERCQLPTGISLTCISKSMYNVIPFSAALYNNIDNALLSDAMILIVLHTLHQLRPNAPISLQHEMEHRYSLTPQIDEDARYTVFQAEKAFHIGVESLISLPSYRKWELEVSPLSSISRARKRKLMYILNEGVRTFTTESNFELSHDILELTEPNIITRDNVPREVVVMVRPLDLEGDAVPRHYVMALIQYLHHCINGIYDIVAISQVWTEYVFTEEEDASYIVRVGLGWERDWRHEITNIMFTEPADGHIV